MKNLNIQSLDFDDIKAGFVEFLKGDPAYKDFNFDGAGINTLNNLLAYNSHLIGYYVKMMLDESFVDSAHNREAMLSHAKRVGYLPRGRRAARADLELKIRLNIADDPISETILINRGTTFNAVNNTQDSRTFQVLDDVLVYSKTVVGSAVTYTSAPIVVYEGAMMLWRFLVDNTNLNQRFVIKDKNIDIDTIRLSVAPHTGATNKTEFNLASDIFEVNSTSNVFYITTNEEGYYQIFFGNGVFGVQPQNGNVIAVSYVSTNGLGGNGAKSFTFNAPAADPLTEYNIGNFSDFEVVTLSVSSGGMEPETVDSMRFTIPSHYRRQNRILSESDYRAVLLSEFRNIDSINVWGGERNGKREYGKVFVSVKPKYSDALTSSSRQEIKDKILRKFGQVGPEVEFVDPEYILVSMDVKAKINLRKTNKSLGQIERLIIDRINEYNETYLSKFDTILSDISLLDYVKQGEDEITSIYTSKTLSKAYNIIHRSTATHLVNFGNEITKGIVSSGVVYGGVECFIADTVTSNLLYLFKKSDGSLIITKSIGSVNRITGLVSFALPINAVAKGYETASSGVVTFKAIPVAPDVNTYLNNLVRIAAIKVVLS